MALPSRTAAAAAWRCMSQRQKEAIAKGARHSSTAYRLQEPGPSRQLCLSTKACAMAPRRHAPTSQDAAQRRNASTISATEQQMDLGRHFYLNKVLEQYASKPATRMTLRQLVFFGRTLGRDRDKILKSANYVRQELAVRIAHRIRDLQALPFVVMTNPHLEEVYEKYWRAFETFRKIPMIRTMEDNDEFCSTLKRLLDDHLTIIPSLTIGIVESAQHLTPEQLDGFMERMLRSRISRRVLAEQHIALSDALDDPFHFFNEGMPTGPEKGDGDHIGIIYTGLKVSNSIQKVVTLLKNIFEAEVRQGIRTGDAAVIPDVVVDGALETRFAYIPEHFEYIFFELIKNSMAAVMRQSLADRDPVCIRATIVEGPPDEDLIVRVSDCGGGLPSIFTRAAQPHAKREHRRRPLQRAPAPRKRRDAIDDELSVSSRQNTVDGVPPSVNMDATLIDDSSSYLASILDGDVTRDVDIAMSHAKHSATAPLQNATSVGTSGATANRAGQTDPLVATVTSFSSVRRRLEIEESELRRQARLSRAKDAPVSALDKQQLINAAVTATNAEQAGSGQEPDTSEAAAILASSDTGIDNMSKMEALRRVGRFKGTVAEQLVADHDANSSHLQVRAAEAIATAASRSAPERETRSAASALIAAGVRQETGLGLPMTKIYTDFFGGSLSLRSLDGHGMDVYVRLPKLGMHKEAIEEIVL